MKKFTLILALVGLAAFGSQAGAVLLTIDDVPAATVLIPYFEMEYGNPNGINTLFSVNNASATSQLVHVTFWSDHSIPVLDFDIYLTGYDVQTLSVRDILENGILPQTGPATDSPGEIPGSNLGIYSFGHINFPNCNTTDDPPVPPVYTIPGLSETFRVHLRDLLTGHTSSVNGTCAGHNYGDNIARGYITMDDSNSCSLLFPSATGYFVGGGLGIADNDNVLWGDYFYVEPAENFAQGETAVHIEADETVIATPGEYSFYGRYVAGTAIDNREPTATTFAVRFANGGGFTGGTDYIVWRDSKFPPGHGTCAQGPNYGELFEQQIVIFDEEENPVTITTGGPSGEPTPDAECTFCDEAQRVAHSDVILGGPQFGWVYLNLNHATALDVGLGAGYVNIAQAWVTALWNASGRFAVGFDAIQLDNANTAVSGGVVLPVLD